MNASITPADLRICGLGAQESARRSALLAVAGACVAGCLGVLTVDGSPVGVLFGAGLGAVAATVAERRRVIHRASERRRQLETALASFLDLTNVLIAGGSGLETALVAASEAGDGWTFEVFRGALHRATAARTPFWEQLRLAGDELEVGSLVETAHTMQLAGEQGARVRRSLAVRAASLRARQMAQLEHDANQTTEHMGLPMVLVFLGFVALLGYPALVTTLGSL